VLSEKDFVFLCGKNRERVAKSWRS